MGNSVDVVSSEEDIAALDLVAKVETGCGKSRNMA